MCRWNKLGGIYFFTARRYCKARRLLQADCPSVRLFITLMVCIEMAGSLETVQ